MNRVCLSPKSLDDWAVAATGWRSGSNGIGSWGGKASATSDYYRALDAMARWSHYYNYQQPHSALCYLSPAEYYRGNPQAHLAERRWKLAMALEARKAYRDNHAQGRRDPSQN